MTMENAFAGCMVCGKPLEYTSTTEDKKCLLCGKWALSNAACRDGHYVCDTCHGSADIGFFPYLLGTTEKNPVRLMGHIFTLPSVHMHGPEHHVILPCVLLTAYHNSGGRIQLAEALAEASRRGGQLPGGICGVWGVCGAAAGAGVFASIATDSNPLNAEAWHLSQTLSSRCLAKIAAVGGPRCCKRTTHLAMEEAVRFTKEELGVSIPTSAFRCTFSNQNEECLQTSCPYYQ